MRSSPSFVLLVAATGLLGMTACGARSSLDEGSPRAGNGTTTDPPATTGAGGGMPPDAAGTSGTGAGMGGTGGAGGNPGNPSTGGGGSAPQPASCAPFAWALSIGGDGPQELIDVVPDLDGNTIVLGSFIDHVDFGQGGISSPGLGMFVVEIGQDGLAHWSRAWPHLDPRMVADVFPPNDWPRAASKCAGVDSAGDVLLAVRFEGPVDLGGGLEAPGERIIKLDSFGNMVWTVPLGDGTADVVPQALVIGDGDHIFVAGNFEGSLQLGPDLLLSDSGETDSFIAELDPGGAPLWGRRIDLIGPSSLAQHERIEAMAGGGTLLSSWISDTVDFGDGPLSTYCVYYSDSGSCQFYSTNRVLHRFAPGGSLIPTAKGGPGFGRGSFDVSDVRLAQDGTLMAAWYGGGPPSWGWARFVLDDDFDWNQDFLWNEDCYGLSMGSRVTVAPAGPDALLFSTVVDDDGATTCKGIPLDPGEWTFKTDLQGNYLCHVAFEGHATWSATAYDAAGGIVFGGTFSDSVHVDSGPIQITGESDVVVIRYGQP